MPELPVWFLITSLFLPRVSLIAAYFAGVATVRLQVSGLLPVGLAVLFPRVVIVCLIFLTFGWSWWLVPHCLAIGAVYSSVGASRRRRK